MIKRRYRTCLTGMRSTMWVNFAAESHVDRSITNPEIFVQTNVLGTVNLLNIAKNAWAVGDDQYKDGVKFMQVSTDEVCGTLGPEGFYGDYPWTPTALIHPVRLPRTCLSRPMRIPTSCR